MKDIVNTLSSQLESIEIEIFSDLHLGSPKCDYPAIQERVRRVQETKNAYAIILGDVINNSTKTSVGDVYSEELTPMQQISLAVETFRPIKDKILGITSGNHERRSYRTEGIDLLYFMAAELGIADKYDYSACLLHIRFGKNSSNRKIYYSLYMTHGDGSSGRTIGGKANAISRRGQIINADIIVAGHTHQDLIFRESSFEVDPQNNSHHLHIQVFVNAASALKYEEYAELYGLKPTASYNPVIKLSGKKKHVEVTA